MTPKEGSRVYLRFDSPSRGRLLEPATVRAITDASWTLEFAVRHPALETGAAKLCYYWRTREFLQQRVRIDHQSSEADGPPFVVAVTALEDPVSADTRSEPRVEIASRGLAATLGDEPHCPIQDVSLSGLAVIARHAYRAGQPLEIVIHYDGTEYVGSVEVMNITPLPDGRARYGLLGVFDTTEGRSLKIGLTRMTLEIQNARLQRKAGAS